MTEGGRPTAGELRVPVPRLARRMRGPALFIVFLVLSLGGCGGSATGTKPTPTPTDPPNLLTSNYIQEEAAQSSAPLPARQILEFWRDTQYADFPKAYLRLSTALRTAIGYKRFVKAFDQAVPIFQLRPRIQSVEVNGDDATVFLLLQEGLKPSPRDAPLAFNLRRDRSQWLISTDPHNVLGAEPQG